MPTAVVRSALALMTSTGATSLLGFVFWITAARLTRPTVVGRASAAVSVMTLLATVSQLNLGYLYARFLPRAGDHARRFLIIGYSGCFAIGLGVSGVFVALGGGSNYLGSGAWQSLVFVGTVAFWTIFVNQDFVLTGLRAARWVPVENAAFGASKLILLLFLASLGAFGIFLSWAIPVVPIIVAVTLYIFTRGLPRHLEKTGRVEGLPGSRRLAKFVVAEYTNSLIGGLDIYLMPVIVVSYLGAQAAGYFYVPWLINIGIWVLLINISTSLVVEAAYKPEEMKALVHRSVRLAALLLLPAMVVLLVAAPLLLQVLGGKYSNEGTTLLRLIAISMPAAAVFILYRTFVWYEAHLWRQAGAQALQVAILFGVSIGLLHVLGINAVGVGIVAAQYGAALCLLPMTVKRWRAISSGKGLTAGFVQTPHAQTGPQDQPGVDQ